ncbi:MAG TPA: hypothetical protein VFF76_10990 [Holophagaceae bacterium]|jgi:hypothetical protein|nr:hypothetical protein [Holophagaceae bacterium]
MTIEDKTEEVDQLEETDDFEPSTAELITDSPQSEKGHEIASRVLHIFEDLKKNAIDKSIERIKLERHLQVGTIIVVIIAASVLSWHGKFDSSMGILFGTMVGFLFGRLGA